MTDVNITYETLYELLRNEKNRDDLQELSETFTEDVIIYLNKIKRMVDETIAGQASDEEKEDRIRQLKNVKNLIKEIYERREKKIINLSMHKSRTQSDSPEVDILLPLERELYENCSRLLDVSKEKMLNTILSGNAPVNPSYTPQAESSEPSAPAEPEAPTEQPMQEETPPEPEPQIEEPQESYENQEPEAPEMPAEPTEEPAQEPQPETPEPSAQAEPGKMQVKFLDAVPKFLGKELEVYGPYEPNDQASLPSDLAHILINKGKAQAI